MTASAWPHVEARPAFRIASRSARVGGLLAASLALQAQALAQGADDSGVQAAALGVVINGVIVSDGEMVYRVAGSRGVWIDRQKLAQWRLLPEAGASRSIDGRPHGLICGDTPAMRCTQDEETALLTIDAAPSSFAALRLASPLAPAVELSDDTPIGAYLNYDLYGSRGADAGLLSGVGDLRVFAGRSNGFVRSGIVHGTGTNASTTQGTTKYRWTGTAAAWQWDWPEQTRSLTLGNYFTEGSAARAPLPALGLRYATNPALRPDLNWSARPAVSGEVLRPSRAELFVDGMFRRSVEVPYGRFEIEADALLPGAGDLELALTDKRGDRSLLTQRYYFAPQLLAESLETFALDLGLAGRSFDLRTRDSTPFVAWQARRGVSHSLTLAGHAAATPDERLLGIAADRQIGTLGVLRTAVSAFDRGHGGRLRAMVGHEYQSGGFSSLVRVEASPADRACPGCARVLPPAGGSAVTAAGVTAAQRQSVLHQDRGQLTLAAAGVLDRRWQVGASFVARELLDGQRQHASSLSLSWRDEGRTQITLSAQQFGGVQRGQQLFIGLLMPLNDRWMATTSSVTRSRVADRSQTALQWSVQSTRRNAAEEGDAQISAFGQVGPRWRSGVNVVRDESFGQWGLEAQGDANGTRASGRIGGGLGWAGNHLFASRRIDDGFIVVDTDGQPDVPVFIENRYAGKTGASGRLMVPGARAFQINRISIDVAALPLEYTLSEDQLDVVPRSRGMAVANFEISDGGELVRVTRPDGLPLPAGARAQISTQRKPAVVNSRGELFVQRATRRSTVEISWPGSGCRFEFVPADAAELRGTEAFLCR